MVVRSDEGTSGSARECPRVTGVYDLDKPNARFAGISSKPSDGLEPSTPSLPSSDEPRREGKRGSQRTRKPPKGEGSLEGEVIAGGRCWPRWCSLSVPSALLQVALASPLSGQGVETTNDGQIGRAPEA
jgi:hypothetical protein